MIQDKKFSHQLVVPVPQAEELTLFHLVENQGGRHGAGEETYIVPPPSAKKFIKQEVYHPSRGAYHR
jgi:hypothetical protein